MPSAHQRSELHQLPRLYLHAWMLLLDKQVLASTHLCIFHSLYIKIPQQTLTVHATRPTRDQNFSNYRDYLHAWMPLLEMEAAVSAVDDAAGVVVDNVKVTLLLD